LHSVIVNGIHLFCSEKGIRSTLIWVRRGRAILFLKNCSDGSSRTSMLDQKKSDTLEDHSITLLPLESHCFLRVILKFSKRQRHSVLAHLEFWWRHCKKRPQVGSSRSPPYRTDNLGTNTALQIIKISLLKLHCCSVALLDPHNHQTPNWGTLSKEFLSKTCA